MGTLTTWSFDGPIGTDVTEENSGLALVNLAGGTVTYVRAGAAFTSSPAGSYTIGRGRMAADDNIASFLLKFVAPAAPAANLNFARIRHNAGDTPVAGLIITPSLGLQLWDADNGLIDGDDLAQLVAGRVYQVAVVVNVAQQAIAGRVYDRDGYPYGQDRNGSGINLGSNPVEGFEIGTISQNPATTVTVTTIRMENDRLSLIPPDVPSTIANRANASCEVWIDGERLPCTRDALAAGEPTVLDNLNIGWGRTFLWEQPEPGTASFEIHDQRTNPQAVEDIVRVGSRVDVWASAIDADRPEFTYMDQDFENVDTDGDLWADDRWRVRLLPGEASRYNFYTDPSMTTLSGKSAGGSATLQIVSDWEAYGTTSIRITPSQGNPVSAVYPYSNTTIMNGYNPGSTYTISATLRMFDAMDGPTSTVPRCILVHCRLDDNTVVEIGRSAIAPNAAGVYRLDTSFTIPSNAVAFYFRLMNGSQNPNDRVWWDGLMINEGGRGSARPWLYFDGDTPDDGYAYEWVGTPNASASTERYYASSPSATVNIFDIGDGVIGPGQGFRSAWFPNSSRTQYEISPADWDGPWVRELPRTMRPGEKWNYSIMISAPDNGRLAFKFLGRTSSNPDVAEVDVVTIDDAAYKVYYGGGGWETITGTLTNTGNVDVWPTWFFTTYPDAWDPNRPSPAIDQLILTAPAEPERRYLVWAGRVSNVTVNPVERGTITIAVTAASSVAEIENISVGDTLWSIETVRERLRRVADNIPAPINQDFTLSIATGLGDQFGQLRSRDVDKQPALSLMQDYATDGFGVAWPMNHPAARSHVWVENLAERLGPWNGPIGTISACDMRKNDVDISQTSDRLINVVDVRWIDQEGTPAEYVERTATVMNNPAVAEYGPFRLAISTEWSIEEDAITLGQAILDWAAAATWGLSGMTFNTRDVDNTNGQAQHLLEVLLDSTRRPGSQLTVTDLPEWMPVELASGFVEGGTITYLDGWWGFELTLTSGSPQ